jgi:hypothetical protein
MAAETIIVSWVACLAAWSYGASLTGASALLATLWAVYIPVRASGDLLVRRFSAPVVVKCGLMVAASGTVLICLGSMGWAYAGVVVFTLGMAPLLPVHQGWVLGRTPAELHGSANAALGIGAAAVTTSAVWLTGLLIDLDARLPFVGAAGLMIAVGAWVGGPGARSNEKGLPMTG